jgi:hypothetical protein
MFRKELDLPVTLECPGRIGLFLYDNNTFILQSFLDRPERVRICINKPGVSIDPIVDIRQVGKTRFIKKARSTENESVLEVLLMPGRYMAFKIK